MSCRSVFVVASLGVLLVAYIAYGLRSSYLKGRTDSRCVVEAQTVVEGFLRDGAAGAFDAYGSFVSLVGTGYSYPFWNISDDHHLTLHRTGVFTKGSTPITIHVRPGWAADSATTNVGRPKIEVPPPNIPLGPLISVKHFDLKR